MRMKRKLLLGIFSVFCLLLSFVTNAQESVTVSGTVTNAQNQPLSGVSVKLRGSKTGTTTNDEGKFSLNVSNLQDAVLEISYVGFLSQRIKVAGKSSFGIKLEEDGNNQKLSEVVIVGTQKQNRRNTIAAVSGVSAKEIENMPAPSVDQLLQGRVAGLNVQVTSGEPGVAPTLVVRGNSRVNVNIGDPAVAQAQAMSGPLYVIDGIPVNPEDIANSIDATGTNFIAGININDIADVVVQKDATATAAWGSRGANGVVMITTKRGRSSKPEFRVNFYTGTVRQPELLPTYTGAEERRRKMDLIYQYATPTQILGLPQILTDSLNPYFNNATDWQGLFFRNGSIKNLDVSMSAATDLLNYRITANYYDEKGIIEAFGLTRFGIRGNFDLKINSKFKAMFTVALSRNDRKRGRKYNNSDDNTPVSVSGQPSSFFGLNPFDSLNFTGLYDKLKNKNINDYYLASITADYTLLPSLKYTFQGSANMNTSNRDYFQPSNINQTSALNGTVQPSVAESYKSSFATYFLSNSLNYSKQYKLLGYENNIVVTGTQQFSRDVANSTQVGGTNGPSNDIQTVTGIPQEYRYGSSNYQASAILSFSTQVQYDVEGKYLLYGSYRADASSRFGTNSKWGYFPAVGAGWIVSDENFMQGDIRRYISFVKIRGSWGIAGTQSNDFYAPFNTYALGGNYNGSTSVNPDYNNGLTKNNLSWTKKVQKNLGIETQLFQNRVSVIADVYDNLSKDDYFNFNLPFYTGYSSIEFNATDLWVSNRGVDLTISASVLPRKSEIQWNTRLIVSHNKNLIAKLPGGNRTFAVDDPYGSSRLYAVGQPVYTMYQLKYLGVYNYTSQIPFNPYTGNFITYFKGNHRVVPGDPIWFDANGDGDVWVDEDNGDQYADRLPTGNPNPLFTGGWINEITYKNFSLAIASVFTYKRDIINTYYQQQIANIAGGYSSNINTFARFRLPYIENLDYWTPAKAAAKPGYSAAFPAINPFVGSYYQYIPLSSMFNEDGSYFKIKNITLNYTLPKAFVARMKMKGIRAYGMMDNVLILTKSTAPDPEAVDQLGVYSGGLYPIPRKFTIGLDIQF